MQESGSILISYYVCIIFFIFLIIYLFIYCIHTANNLDNDQPQKKEIIVFVGFQTRSILALHRGTVSNAFW